MLNTQLLICSKILVMRKVWAYSFLDMIRSYWTMAYGGFFLIVLATLLFIGGGGEKAVVSLMNVILFLVPLITMIYGLMYLYQVRDYVEVLLAQPIGRKAVFTGYFLGIASALCLTTFVGLAIPTLLGFAEVWSQSGWWILLFITMVLTVLFTALASNIVLKYDNRLRGFGIGLLWWLALSVLYDGLVLILLVFFEGYPMQLPALVVTLLNPIDLARVLLIFQLDFSALMGFTGAVFEKFFGTFFGTLSILAAFAIWIGTPVLILRRRAAKKDF